MGYDSHLVQGACVEKFLGEMVNFKMMTQASFLDGLVPMTCFMWKLYPFPTHTPELVRGQPATEGECREGKFWSTLWPASCTPDCPFVWPWTLQLSLLFLLSLFYIRCQLRRQLSCKFASSLSPVDLGIDPMSTVFCVSVTASLYS